MSTGTIETTGIVTNVMGNNNYHVEIGSGDEVRTILCHLRGKLRRFKISVVVGDEVTVELPPPSYDQGRITFRGKKEDRPAARTDRRKKGKGRRR